jgi:TonB family protein
MSKKDSSLAPHGAKNPSAEFKAGQPKGNATVGKTEGTANARVKGRNVLGALPKPNGNGQDEGTVVVAIKVDQYGNVTEAKPGAQGTTVTNSTLWNAARAAAMKTHFNQSADAPVLQEGTITYIFKLK